MPLSFCRVLGSVWFALVCRFVTAKNSNLFFGSASSFNDQVPVSHFYGRVRGYQRGSGSPFPRQLKNVCACFLALLNGTGTEKALIKVHRPHIVERGGKSGRKWGRTLPTCPRYHKRPVHIHVCVRVEQILCVFTGRKITTLVQHLSK